MVVLLVLVALVVLVLYSLVVGLTCLMTHITQRHRQRTIRMYMIQLCFNHMRHMKIMQCDMVKSGVVVRTQ